MQLMYKAIFELSSDRADFVSMLFAKPRPSGLTATSTAQQIFSAFGSSATSNALYDRNLAAIKNALTRTHHLPLLANDWPSIETIYQTFYQSGF